MLRGSDAEYRGDGDYALVRELARDALGEDEHGYRAEFLSLVAAADRLDDRSVEDSVAEEGEARAVPDSARLGSTPRG